MKAGKSSSARHAEIDRALAPDDLHDFLDREGEAEGEQQFGDVAVLVHAAQAVALDHGADRAGQQRRDDQRGPEAEPAADLEAEERAEHVEAGMGEVQHAEHAEDDGQAARHQEQQHAEQHAVQRGYDDQFKHMSLQSCGVVEMGAAARALPCADMNLRQCMGEVGGGQAQDCASRFALPPHP